MHPLINAFWQGRNVLKKNTGAYFDSEKKPKKACVLGAMYYGFHKKTLMEDVPLAIAFEYPQIRQWVKPAPCGHDDEGGYLSAVLIHLNDEHTGHDWPDKKIMEWAETVLA